VSSWPSRERLQDYLTDNDTVTWNERPLPPIERQSIRPAPLPVPNQDLKEFALLARDRHTDSRCGASWRLPAEFKALLLLHSRFIAEIFITSN
jgi:hypothetical protein